MVGRDFAKRVLVAGALLVPATQAMADSIDGDWCSPNDGKHVRIEGPNVTTPAGSTTTGNYTRHAFTYVVPEGDPGAGDTVAMQLLNEEQTRVSIAGGSAETWHRCQLNV